MRIPIKVEYLIEELSRDGGRLGRHVEHDARSRNFSVGELPGDNAPSLKSVAWPRRSAILDQGNIGSCTGNATAGAIATDSAHRKGGAGIDEHIALRIYQKATRVDHILGEYLPDDTGSTGLAAMKAAKQMGFVAGYRHAFSPRAMLIALQTGPVIVGMAWRTGCDTPDSNGIIDYAGDVRGGHEILCRGVDMDKSVLWFDNSWGEGWGHNGSFGMRFLDFEVAMADSGDMTVPMWM